MRQLSPANLYHTSRLGFRKNWRKLDTSFWFNCAMQLAATKSANLLVIPYMDFPYLFTQSKKRSERSGAFHYF